uniref:hypothetical protein n=1 Tax=Bacteroides cellulosilyticus TaxID=246787 RepID=UPI0032EAC320
ALGRTDKLKISFVWGWEAVSCLAFIFANNWCGVLRVTEKKSLRHTSLLNFHVSHSSEINVITS